MGSREQGKKLHSERPVYCFSIAHSCLGTYREMNSCRRRIVGNLVYRLSLCPVILFVQTNQAALQIEKMLSQMPEIQKVFTGVGAQESGSLTLSSNNLVQFNVALVPKEKSKKNLQWKLEKKSK